MREILLFDISRFNFFKQFNFYVLNYIPEINRKLNEPSLPNVPWFRQHEVTMETSEEPLVPLPIAEMMDTSEEPLAPLPIAEMMDTSEEPLASLPIACEQTTSKCLNF